MTRRSILATLFALALAGAASAARPNVLFIVADDLGYADLGVQGCKDIPTPNIDTLGTNGIRCTSGYVSGPYCSPTRAGLMTGRYQQRFGHEFNPEGDLRGNPEIGLPLTETTIADRFAAAGYVTGMVGKWHLGMASKYHPTKRGFREFFGFPSGAHSYLPEKKISANPIMRGTEPLIEPEYLTDAFGREACAFIDRHKAEPFFLYLAFNAVHTPMEAAGKYLARFPNISDKKRRTYAAMTSAMDDAVGRVLAKLRETGIEENTLITFISDNGGPTMQGTTINSSCNDPLRGSKRQTLEGGIRVPFMVQWKGHVPAGKLYHQPVIQLDFIPTALAACSVEVKPEWKLDGVDLLPYLTGSNDRPPHDALYWRLGRQMAIRRGDWKLVKYDDKPPQLYNLTEDIGESKDLAKQQPDKYRELDSTWQKWNVELAPARWTPRRLP